MHGAVLLLLLAANDHRAPGPQVAVRFTIVPPRTVVADMWGTHGVSADEAVALPDIGPCTAKQYPADGTAWAWSAQIRCVEALQGGDDVRGFAIPASSWWSLLNVAGAKQATLSMTAPGFGTLHCGTAECSRSWTAWDGDRADLVVTLSVAPWSRAAGFGGAWLTLLVFAALVLWTRRQFMGLPPHIMEATWPRLLELWSLSVTLAPVAVMLTAAFTGLAGVLQWHDGTAAQPIASFVAFAAVPTLGAGALGLAIRRPARLVWGPGSSSANPLLAMWIGTALLAAVVGYGVLNDRVEFVIWGCVGFVVWLVAVLVLLNSKHRPAGAGELHTLLSEAARIAGFEPAVVHLIRRSPLATVGSVRRVGKQVLIPESAITSWSARELKAGATMAFLNPGSIALLAFLGAAFAFWVPLAGTASVRVATAVGLLALTLLLARRQSRALTNAALRAAQALDDPEAVIAALGRIAPLQSWPWQWDASGGISGRTLSNRVEHVAAAHGISPGRRDELVKTGLQPITPVPMPECLPKSPLSAGLLGMVPALLVPPCVFHVAHPSVLTLDALVTLFAGATVISVALSIALAFVIAGRNERERVPTAEKGGWIVGAAPGPVLRIYHGVSFVPEYVELWMDGSNLHLRGPKFQTTVPAQQLIQCTVVPGFLMRGAVLILRYRQADGDHRYLQLWASTGVHGSKVLRQLRAALVQWQGVHASATLPAAPVHVNELSVDGSVEAAKSLSPGLVVADVGMTAMLGSLCSGPLLNRPLLFVCAVAASATSHVLRLGLARLSWARALPLPPPATPGSAAAASSGTV